MRANFIYFVALGAALLTANCNPDSPSEHSHPDADHAGRPEPIQVTVFSRKLELFLEYLPPVAGEPVDLLCHFTILETGQPVRLSSLTVETSTPVGAPIRVVEPRPIRDGIFRPRVSFASAGTFELRMRVAGLEVEDEVLVGPITVCSSIADIKPAPSASASGDTIPLLMEQQWKIGLQLCEVARRELSEWLASPGEIMCPPHAKGVVSSPLVGRLLKPVGGRLPRLGDRVESGQILAIVESPLLHSAEVAERSFDIRQKALGVAEEVARANANLDFARTEHARLKRLLSNQTASEREFNEAQRELSIAEAEHESARSMQAWFEASMPEYPEFAWGESAALEDGRGVRMTSLVTLRSPISGEVVIADGVEGAIVAPNEPLYRIINRRWLWLATQVSEFDLSRLSNDPTAHFVPHGLPERRFDVQEIDGMLVHLGSQVDVESRTVPVIYEFENPDDNLRDGMFVDTFLRTRHSAAGLAIPREAIVTDGGRSVAFVLVTGESFERRELKLGLRDGNWVEVLSGLAEGERVVCRGAFAVKMAHSSPVNFGHGHAH